MSSRIFRRELNLLAEIGGFGFGKTLSTGGEEAFPSVNQKQCNQDSTVPTALF